MKRKYLIILMILAIISVIVFATLIYVSSGLSKSVKAYYEYDTQVNVGDYVGFNLDDDKIYFGTVFSGGFGKRAISLNSTVSGYIVLRVDGPMHEFMYSVDSYDYINEGEEISYLLYVHPLNHVKQGVYESKLKIYILEERNSLLELFLDGKPLKIFTNASEVPTAGSSVKINITYPNETNSTI